MDFKHFCKTHILKLETTYDVDTTDRFKYTYNTWILVFSALISLARDIMGTSIVCWVPNQFSPSWRDYIQSYCYIEGSYFVPFNSTNLPRADERKANTINYYQWVPFILIFHALLTYSPRFIWKRVQSLQNVQIASVTTVLRKNAKNAISNPINLGANGAVDILEGIQKWKLGNFLTLTLIVFKFLSLAVILFQFLFFDWFLSGKIFSFHGLQLLSDLLNGRDWKMSGKFPRTTFCDVEVREMATVQTWTLQCVLQANMYNEKLFLFIWFWYLFLTIISAINLIKWIYWCIPSTQMSFLSNILKTIDEEVTPRKVRRLFRKLKNDGTTVVRLIQENSNIYNAANYLKPLWDATEEIKFE